MYNREQKNTKQIKPNNDDDVDVDYVGSDWILS